MRRSMGFFNFNFNKQDRRCGYGGHGNHGNCCNRVAGIISGSPIPQFVIDKNHLVTCWNKALEESSGISSAEIIGTNRHWRAFYGFERPCMADILVDQRFSLIPQLYKGKYAKSKLVPEAYEATDFFPAMGKKGKWLYFTAAAIRDESGNITGAVETLEDITERKNAEDALKKQKEKLERSKKALTEAVSDLNAERIKLGEEKAKMEAILMSIGDGVVVTDRKGNVVLFNKKFGRMIGWSEEEAVGKPLADIMPCQDEKGNLIPADKRFILRVLAGEEPETAIFYYLRKDGTRFPGAVTVTDITLGINKLGAVSVIRDVTREMEIDRAKSEFISLASHQLRDAPTTIRWSAEALLSGTPGALNEKQREYVEEIYKRNKSAIGLINDLLNVSRIDIGTFVIEPEPASLKDICINEIKQFERLVKEKHLKIEENYDAGIPKIQLDPQLMQIIFQNLISNAVYYTPDGGQIIIDLKFKEGKKDEVLFKISDNGIGISQEQQAGIFTRMFRADNAKKARSGGSGLGLYVIKSILNQAGWNIRFESREGKGTTFYLDIPLSGMAKRPGQTKLTRGAV